MKKIMLLFAFLFTGIFAHSQVTCTQTFTASGLDNDPTVLTINAADVTCQGAGTVVSMRLVNPVDSFTNGNCGNWYTFNLSVDGGASTNGCAAAFNGYDISGFTSLTFTSQDDDNWAPGDAVTITIDVEVTFNATAPPNCDANLLSPSNGQTDAPIDGNITWSPASGGVAGYNLTVGTSSGAGDILATTDVGNVTNYALGGLNITTQYFVTIEPYNAMGSANGCVEQSFTTYTPVLGDDCSIALPINCGDSATGTTVGATSNGAPTGFCGTGTGAPGVWYSFTGNGDAIVASLCNSTFDTKIQIYEGNCNVLDCVDGNDDACGVQSEVSFLSVDGTQYYIYVFGFGTSTGDYQLDLTCTEIFAPITADITTYTNDELIDPILVDVDCALVDNFNFGDHSPGTNQTGLSYFTNGGGDFPFDDGVIISSGEANEASGPFDGGGVSGPGFPGGGPGDADLENILGLAPGSTNDAVFMEFDFVPIAPQISFNYIMASSEYNGPTGTFQCTYEDAFAFILTHVPTGTVTNLAQLPTSDTGNFGVSVTNIHPEIPGFAGCPAANEQYFDSYTQNFGNIAYDGRTVPLTAFANVIAGDNYRIKLVVADQGDSAVDTAIFIEGGSFSLGSLDLGDDVYLGDPEALCEGEMTTLNAGVLPNGTDIIWLKDGQEIPGETTVNPVTGDTEQILNIDTTGDYTASVYFTLAPDCTRENTVHIEFYPNPAPDLGMNIVKCAQEAIVLDANVMNASDPNMGPLNYEWTYNGNVIQNGPDSTLAIGGTEVFANNTSNSGSVTYLNPITNASTYIDLVSGVYNLGDFSVTVSDTVTGCNGSSSVNVSFYENANCVDLPTGISPNGDGVNDCIIFDDLEITTAISRFQVYNRYGTRVYDVGQYLNQWCGTTDDGDKLVTGTYYYILEFEDGREPIKSWIYVNRPE